MSTTGRIPSLSPSRSSSPDLPAQPDHFYGNEDVQLPPSPDSDGRNWLDPADDPTAQRGIPVFKPTMEEFEDFEAYMTRVEPWGMRSGIVKIIPPQEWTHRLPSVVPHLDKVRLKDPIEQVMLGQGGLFQQQNLERHRVLSVREWFELCAQDDFRAPGVHDVGVHARAYTASAKVRTRRTRKTKRGDAEHDVRMSETAEPESRTGIDADGEEIDVKHEEEEQHIPVDRVDPASALISPPHSTRTLSPSDNAHEHAQQSSAPVRQEETPAPVAGPSQSRHPLAEEEEEEEEVHAVIEGHVEEEDVKPKKRRRAAPTRECKDAQLAERAKMDQEWLQTFDPQSAWLPSDTSSASYTTEFCKELERRYWRNCGFGKSPWYGADMQGSLFTDETTSWNVASLPSALTRLLPSSAKGLPGVNTPYLYFGMWRATFAWHVEDMDLFSINYIHFGAPKFWYAMPQARANALEQTMRGLFPGAGKTCSQFLRHKSYLVSPTLLAKTACRPNFLVQKAGEFVITFPRGYHAGFNLGFNCAESVNFALESWIDIGRKAQACACVPYSVRIDVDQLLQDRAAEHTQVFRNSKNHRRIQSEPEPETEKGKEKGKNAKPKPARKRKSDGDSPVKLKKLKIKPVPKSSEQPVASSSKLPPPAPTKALKVTLRLPPQPKPKEPETFPCCLCPSMSRDGLLRVSDPPAWWYGWENAETAKGPCMAHLECASVVPETWVDEVEAGEPDAMGVKRKEKVVFGVDGIVKDRWNLKCTACTKPKSRVHGAPIQCTKGKCPKAFHVSCARDGHANNIVYRVLREVEKEVVLLDNQPPMPVPPPPPEPVVLQLYPLPPGSGASISAPADAQPMDVDPVASAPPVAIAPVETQQQPRVLKTIRKHEVEVLCHQHNPDVLAAKRAQQQDRIRNALLALPPMSRIKLRVTAGVFEVTLVRIIEETSSVEVLWDRGVRREFKWRSVVFGECDVVVGQKPVEPAPEPERLPVPVAPSHPASHQSSPVPLSTPIASSSAPAPAYTPAPGTAASTSTRPYSQTRHYPYPAYYQPGTSSYQYPTGNWSYYPPPPAAAASSSQPPCSPAPSQPSYQHPTAYGQPQYGQYYPYPGGAARMPYAPYSQYSGYAAYTPPLAAPTTATSSASSGHAQPQPPLQVPSQVQTQPRPQVQVQAPSQVQAQPQVQVQSQLQPRPRPQPQATPQAPSQTHTQTQAHAGAQAVSEGNGLRWQEPYRGPQGTAPKFVPAQVPIPPLQRPGSVREHEPSREGAPSPAVAPSEGSSVTPALVAEAAPASTMS